MITTDQKLRAVEDMIEAMKGDSEVAIFKAIAKDIRARLDGAPSVALVEIERRMAAVQRSRTALGYENGAMRGVAEELICRWPVVKQALELFGVRRGDGESDVTRSDLVDIAAEKRGETQKALRLYGGARTEWVPKQHVEDNGDGTFTMPEWVAREKGFI